MNLKFNNYAAQLFKLASQTYPTAEAIEATSAAASIPQGDHADRPIQPKLQPTPGAVKVESNV